jgi:hypothetical protein
VRPVIRDTFFDFTAQREGFTPFMYADTLNLVTTGVGNLIDAGPRNGFDISAGAMAPAMGLPWKFKAPGWTSKNPVASGAASATDIREAWIRTKLQEEQIPGFNQKGGFAYAGLTPLTLDLDGLRALFNRTLASFDKVIASRYPGYETWPADAQQMILSMAWAMGPAFNFPAFKDAVDRRDFDAAAPLSFFKGGGGTPDRPTGRNAENQIMARNAAMIERTGTDPDRLIFPGTSGAVAPGGGVVASTFGAGLQIPLASVALAAAGISVAILGLRALSPSLPFALPRVLSARSLARRIRT